MTSSPTLLSSPSMSITSWDETMVHGFFVNVLNLEQYEDLIYEHGITGDVLSAMDHLTLSDMGILSLGHRLKLLRAVWEIKKDQGVAFAEDDWKPIDAPVEGNSDVDRLWDVVNEQHERIMHLERDHVRMLNALDEYGISVPLASSADGDIMHGIVPSKHAHSSSQSRPPRTNGHGGTASDDEAGPSRPTRRSSQLFPSSLASSTATAPPLSSDSATFGDAFTPTTANGPITFDSPTAPDPLAAIGAAGSAAKLKPAPPPLTRLISGGSLVNATNNAASPPALTPPALKPVSSNATASSSTSAPPAAGDAKTKAKDDTARAAKSFRVTLEDPCWKVLPAALKKYKINDDWKQYALFICFGNTERCLSYDEKPLMLFQKLKETGQKPVFMLRHIRDIKSPISVAQQKQAVKLGLPANSDVDVLPKIKPTTDTSTSPTKASSLAPGSTTRGEEGASPNGGTGAFPELPSPGLVPDGQGPAASVGAQGKDGTLVDKDGNVRDVTYALTYAVAIYPYVADRLDEFDVAVGATFVILQKAKGWYIVQKDPDGLGKIVPDQNKSGWVPAGCLLELSSPISSVSPAAPDGGVSAYPGLLPLPPGSIMSSSYPGVVLMDYVAKGEDELSLKEGDNVKIYKKYCHWSYVINSDTGERGWVPAWFIGKVDDGISGTRGGSNPNTAALTGVPRSAEGAATEASPEGGEEKEADL